MPVTGTPTGWGKIFRVFLLRLRRSFHAPDNNYVAAYARRGWGDHPAQAEAIEVQTIPNARIVMWVDQPGAVAGAVDAFVARH